MPTPKTVGSLFSGIGGFDLAAPSCGWVTRWYSEIDEYACRIMAKHFPEAENLGDITKLTNPPPVDVLVGGFPCQDISVANAKGEGINGKRSGLWAEYARIIGEVRPSWAVIENSPLLRRKGLDRVLRDLMALGYDAEWHCVPASAAGAPHQRDRIWIAAYPSQGEGEARLAPYLADALRSRLARHQLALYDEAEAGGGEASTLGPTPECCPACGGLRHPWDFEPAVGRVAHGVPSRVDRLRTLGNAVVPDIPHLIFRAIEAYESQIGIDVRPAPGSRST